jgi:hypothetical protein
LSLRGRHLERGFLEPFAQLVDLGLGILAAADFIAPVPAGE